MLVRFLTGIISVVFLGIVMVMPYSIFAVATVLIGIIATYELLNVFEKQGKKPLKLQAYFGCAILAAILSQNIFGFAFHVSVYAFMIFAYFSIAFINYILAYDKYKTGDIGVTVFANVYLLVAILSINYIRLMDAGLHLIWILFIGAWGTDVCAYLVGVLFGKHKILPQISPKKSWEGFWGGIIGCAIITVGFAILFEADVKLGLGWAALIGLLNGFFSQIGDWVMSALKREAEVKDFGAIFPGHGGIMDRFDSILFIAPLVFTVLALCCI